MNKDTGLKIAGLALMGLTAVVNIGAGLVSNAQQKKQIEDAAQKAVSDLMNKEG